MKDLCELCRKNPPDQVYAVDRDKPKDICGACMAKHPPRVLDNLLGVKQPFYGDGKDPAPKGAPASAPAPAPAIPVETK